MTVLSDREIAIAVRNRKMIEPFDSTSIREVGGVPIISRGSSSFGYDLSLSPIEFKIIRCIPGAVINPKKFNRDFVEDIPLEHDEDGAFFLMPPYSYGLGVSIERLNIPRNVTVHFWGKSTYARCGIVPAMTPAEAGWCGYLTIELMNPTPSACRLYANEGVIQAVFFEGENCSAPYDGQRKYQDQEQSVVLPRM